MGELKLIPERFQKKNKDLDVEVSATCVSITHCGNFVIVGYSTGHVDRFVQHEPLSSERTCVMNLFKSLKKINNSNPSVSSLDTDLNLKFTISFIGS